MSVRHSGWLDKKGDRGPRMVRGWRRRWFQLTDTLTVTELAEKRRPNGQNGGQNEPNPVVLRYFENDKMEQVRHGAGFIELSEVTRVSGNKRREKSGSAKIGQNPQRRRSQTEGAKPRSVGESFKLYVLTPQRRWVLRAETMREKEEWLKIMRQAVSECGGSQEQTGSVPVSVGPYNAAGQLKSSDSKSSKGNRERGKTTHVAGKGGNNGKQSGKPRSDAPLELSAASSGASLPQVSFEQQTSPGPAPGAALSGGIGGGVAGTTGKERGFGGRMSRRSVPTPKLVKDQATISKRVRVARRRERALCGALARSDDIGLASGAVRLGFDEWARQRLRRLREDRVPFYRSRVAALFDYDAVEDNELTFRVGDQILLLEQVSDLTFLLSFLSFLPPLPPLPSSSFLVFVAALFALTFPMTIPSLLAL
jgi:PH domain/SH3 domain